VKNSNSIFLSLGSNIGDKESNLIDGVRLISNFAKIIKISSVYKTEPLLYKEQDDFFNIVIEIEYQGTARNLLIKIKEIETQMGRKKNFRYGPRLIDIDIIFFKVHIELVTPARINFRVRKTNPPAAKAPAIGKPTSFINVNISICPP